MVRGSVATITPDDAPDASDAPAPPMAVALLLLEIAGSSLLAWVVKSCVLEVLNGMGAAAPPKGLPALGDPEGLVTGWI